MKTPTFSVQIPTPCHEDWHKMTPTEKGRHCDACNLVVIDFSAMSMEEVKAYFQNNCGKRICGRVRESQLVGSANNNNLLQNLHHRLVNIRARYPIASVFLWIITGMLTLTGCQETRTVGEMEPYSDSTHLHNKMDSSTQAPACQDSQKK